MVDINRHKVILITILRSFYSDILLRSSLGFKGGTASMLFYDLPRFSVDLDFDLLAPKKEDKVFTKLKEILPQFGEIREAIKKRNTIFFLLNYQKDERNLKVEVSIRPTKAKFATKIYLGIPILVMKEEDMIAAKLSTVLTRKKFAARDLFDLWFFLKNQWRINEEIVNENTQLSLTDALEKVEEKVKKVRHTEFLAGIGDLLDNKQKAWVRNHLRDELIFQLKLYRETLKK